MGMNKVASRMTAKTFTATGSGGALTIASGSPVTVYGMVFRAVTSNTWTVTDGAGTALFIVAALAGTTATIEVCWKADAGLTIQATTATDGSCVVFHESPGN